MRDTFRILILILLDITILSPPTMAYPSLPGEAQIIFTSDRGGDYDIYLLNAHGLRNLTRHPAFDSDPAWSPDGSKIAFVSDRSGGLDIYVMDADGRNPRRLTKDPEVDGFPDWSPDGERIAFMSHRWRGPNIFLMDISGRIIRAITNSGWDWAPAWSPDGRWIVFSSSRERFNTEIYIVDSEGGNLQKLTNNASVDEDPDWYDPTSRYGISPEEGFMILWVWLKNPIAFPLSLNRWASTK